MSELHIKRPINPRFVARVRRSGCRRYFVIGRNYRSAESAARTMMRHFLKVHEYKRGDVLMIEDWYEPNMLMEITR
jgi:hypothetical protein